MRRRFGPTLDVRGAALDAIGDRTELIVVGQSFGGFTAQLIYDRTAVDVLVLVAGMIPSPGKAPKMAGEYGIRAGGTRAGRRLIATIYHDVQPELTTGALERQRGQIDGGHCCVALSRPKEVANRL
jgi:predicted alpha/beta-hydrolase family hydrolase